MIYALTITIAAGLLLLALIGFGVVLTRRAAGRGWPSIGRWRWYPSPLGLFLLLPLVVLLLFRFLPALLVIPFILPFFRRGRRMWGPLCCLRNLGRGPQTPGSGHNGQHRPIEGQYRPLDEE